ncbi:lipase family protein [Paraburkholderia sediminicola]|uniref:lipase family protein n=1 Tax=Paraburkholderia sediminicola TaxID=458836 RepID=UPI0038B71DBB
MNLLSVDYALIAQEAYSAKPDIGSVPGPSCAIVRNTADGLVIAFPGTDSIADLLTDFNVTPTAVPGLGRIHNGFWQAWSAIAPQVESAAGDAPVTFVGHSLGAALAIIAGASRVAAGKPVQAVYGFEPPRVSPEPTIGNVLAKTSVILFKNGNDAVTDVPPLWPQSAKLIGIGTPRYPWPNLRDHAIARVITALQAIAGSGVPA